MYGSVNAETLLTVWEQGDALPPVYQALGLLAVAYPEATGEDLTALSIGARDVRLLRLREQLFGPSVTALAVCPECGENVELAFHVDDVRAAPDGALAVPRTLETNGYQIRYRLPNSGDLMALGASDSVETARMQLLARCVLEAIHDGEAVEVTGLSEEAQRAVAEQMARDDPQAEVLLDLTCPACGHAWHTLFDVVSFLWKEIEVWAGRLLREVHTLARAYGWHEKDILAMPARRRQRYLELLNE